MRRVVIAAALGAAAAAAVCRSLPAPPARLPAGGLPPVVRGAVHVHTRASDGSGTVDEVAAAAARAGLQFVVVSDHGDAAEAPAPPEYRHGVLCIDAVEISAVGGHVVALGLPEAPYPLGGESRDVVEDVQRLGGLSIAAHPGSPNPELRWTEWTSPVDGIEWLSGDSEWRDERLPTLARTLLTYPFRPAALGLVLDRPDAVLRRWDVLTSRRRVVAVASGDAHGGVLAANGGQGSRGPAVRLPSYESVFRTFSVALPSLSLGGDAGADAAAVIDAIRRGRVYSAVDAIATPALVGFSATASGESAAAGDVLRAGSPVRLRVTSNAPSGATVRLLKDGGLFATANGPELERVAGGEPAVYRVEIDLPGAPGDPPVPWVVTNPIYVRSAGQPGPVVRPAARQSAVQYDDGQAPDWRVESSPRSQGALDVVRAVEGTQLRLRWALGGTMAEGPYVALVMPAGPALPQYDRVIFKAWAGRPQRLSLQIREPAGAGDDRWRRAFYVDEQPRVVTVFFDEMRPVGITARRRPVLPSVRDVLFVIDTMNSRAGASGTLWIDDVRYGR